jgi:hypothetical protein
MVDNKLIESFHTMWDSFPSRVRLIQKDRTVLAVNKAAEKAGMAVRVKCIDTPSKDSHAGCKANAALKERKGIYQLNADKSLVRFWIPVEGYDDIYVHFSIPAETLT